jgi:polyisoprenoid-binding protein YceI
MTALPTGLVTGTYTVDPTHTSASFTVRHAGISKVRGTLAVVSGSLVVGESIEDSSVSAEIDAASVSTGNPDRDAHLTSADFWDAEKNPVWTFAATSVAADGDDFAVTGDLTINGVTRSVVLLTEFAGIATDPFGNSRAGFEASTEISRKDFDLTWNAALETGGVLVGDKVKIELDISAIKA